MNHKNKSLNFLATTTLGMSLAVFIFGCTDPNSPTARQSQNSGGGGQAQNLNKNSGAGSSSSQSENGRSANANKPITKQKREFNAVIDNALKSKELSADFKAQLKRYKKLNYPPPKEKIESLIQRELALLDREKRFGPAVVDTGYEGVYTDVAPTRSRTKPRGKQLDYSQAPKNCREYNKSYIQYLSRANQHFEKIHSDLPSEQLNELVKFLNDALRYQICFSTNKSDLRMKRRLERLEIPPQVERDPWFQTVHALVDVMCNRNYAVAAPRSTRAIKSFRAANYPSFAVLYGYNINYTLNRAWRNVEKRSANAVTNTFIENYADVFCYYVTQDFDVSGAELRAAWFGLEKMHEFLRIYNKPKVVEKLYERCLRDANVEPWIKEMIRGKRAGFRAWAARGGGYAGSVTEKGWEQFGKHQKEAEIAFQAALDLNPYAPEPANELLGTAISGVTEKSAEELFEIVMEIQPDFLPAVDKMLHQSRPRWGGSFEEMMAIGKRFAEQGDYETIAPYALISAYVMAATDEHINTMETKDQLVEKELVKELHDCVEKLGRNYELHGFGVIYPHEWMQSSAIVFSYIARDGNALFDDFKNLDGEFIKEAADLIGVPIEVERLRSEVNAKYGGASVAFKKLEMFNKMDLDELVNKKSELEELLDEAKAQENDPAILTQFQRPLNQADYYGRFRSGEWVNLEFDPNFTNWRLLEPNKVKFNSKTSVILNCDGVPKENVVVLYYKLPGPKTVEFDIEWLDEFEEIPFGTSAGFYPMTILDRTSVFCGFNPRAKQFRHGAPKLSTGLQSLTGYGAQIEELQSVKMRFNMDGKYYEAFMNDWFMTRKRSEQFVPVTYLSFGNPANQTGNYRVKISNIRVRKWDDGHLPIGEEDLLDHFDKMTELHPESFHHWRWRGKAAHRQGKFELADNYFRRAQELGDRSSEILFFLGDYLERRGDSKAALKMYQNAYKNPNDVRFIPLRNLNSTQAACAAAEAGFRYHWLVNTSSDPAVRENEFVNPTDVKPVTSWEWVNKRLRATEYARQGDFTKAVREMNSSLDIAPASVEDDLLEQLSLYKSNKLYTRENGKPPFYLKGISFPHFK